VILAKANTDFQLPYPAAIIFDFDGVVVDSLQAHLDAWNKSCVQIFQRPLDNFSALSGLSTRAIASKISHSFGHPSLAKPLTALKETYLESLIDQIELIPGIRYLMNQLETNQIPFALGSNSKRTFINSVLMHHDIKIPVVISSDDVKKPKPHPEIFLTCAKKLGLPFESYKNILVFEDSTHGIESAGKAGMTAIGVTTLHEAPTLIKKGASFTVDNFFQVHFATD